MADKPEFPEIYDPRRYAQEVLSRSQEALRAAVTVVSPENPDANPMDVFPAPQERRSDDQGIPLTNEQETGLREAASALGFGRSGNRSMSELGLSGGHVIIEGGQLPKILAEALVVTGDVTSQPATIIFSASPYRHIKGIEAETAARILGVEQDQLGATEYDVAKQAAESLPGYVKSEPEEVLPFGYDIQEDFRLTSETSGQLIRIGSIDDTPVVMFRVDRENYAAEGETEYRKQPSAAAVIGIVDGILKASGDTDTPIAFLTAGTYQASREVDAARVALSAGRKIGVPTYGTVLLATVKGEPTPTPSPINQLPGELHRMAQQIKALEAVLAS